MPVLLSNNEAAFLLAIEMQCRVEEAFAWLINPKKKVYLTDEDYLDMSSLLKGSDKEAPMDFQELAEVFNKNESYLKEAYYKKIECLDLYDPRQISIEASDLIIMKYLANKSRDIDTIAGRYPEYSPNIIREALTTFELSNS